VTKDHESQAPSSLLQYVCKRISRKSHTASLIAITRSEVLTLAFSALSV
jgi:hypothetical protein